MSDTQEPWDEDALPDAMMVMREIGETDPRTEVDLVQVTKVTSMEDHRGIGYADTLNGEFVAWHVRADIRRRGFYAHHLERTVIQIMGGGLSGGEGWALCRRWVADGLLGEEQLRILAPLLDSGALPYETYHEEL
ncbi:MAG: hypothetical protein SOI13_01685 [Bifidobacterium mongoliense]|jgi:hypothetical protein|uniref:hypothetical protein n=1 Tax=Bifidobacterium mongoliense TaxID=518643 RepID=UPI002F357391